MAFQQVTVENRVSEFPSRRTLTREDNTTEIVTVTRNEGNVSTEGTAWGAAYANDLESRINTETNLLETNFGHVETNTTASKSYSVGETLVLNGQLYKVTAAIAQGATLTVGTNIAVHSVSAINSNISEIKTYVGADGKLHFIDSTGADSVLPFNGKRTLTVNLRCTAGVNGLYGDGTWVFTINTDGTVTASCPSFGNGNANIYGSTVSYIVASLS